MNYEIDDPLDLLSKTQKSKIRKMLNDNIDKKRILSSIYYQDEKLHYKDIHIEKVNDQLIKVHFSLKDPKEELRQKLRFKLQNASQLRSNMYKDECWKLYYQILNHPNIRSIPNESLIKAVPNPDQIREQKDTYRMINQMNPNPLIKEYIEKCLQE